MIERGVMKHDQPHPVGGEPGAEEFRADVPDSTGKRLAGHLPDVGLRRTDKHRGSQPTTVRAEAQLSDRAMVTGLQGVGAACGQVPEPHASIGVARSQGVAVG